MKILVTKIKACRDLVIEYKQVVTGYALFGCIGLHI